MLLERLDHKETLALLDHKVYLDQLELTYA